jgi:hypothetical protein
MEQVYTYQYNVRSPVKIDPLSLELLCFLHNRQPEQGGLGAAGHFKNAVSILFGEKHKDIWKKKPDKEFRMNPWAERSIEAACEHNYLAVLGCANSSKTTTFAMWALINWLASPLDTIVLVTSTSLKDSRRRIWGKITEYFSSIRGLPGKLVDSEGKIRAYNETTGKHVDTGGIFIIAGDRKKEKEAIGKLIGIKAKRVILIADELPELSPALIAAAFSNLAVNKYFQLVGIGNFASIFDPLGELSKPLKGWDSICPEDDEWETTNGFCIRFDGLRSPNVALGVDDYPEIYSNKNLMEHRRTLGGENTALFWRMCRSFPCPEAACNVIYSESDFIRGHVFDQPEWAAKPVDILGFDPSFSSGGDRFAVAHGQYGKDKNGLQQLALKNIVVLHEDLSIRNEPRDIQMAKQIRKYCEDNKIEIENVGGDASGPGGIAFSSILITLWKTGFVQVKFGGKASKTTISYEDPRTGEDTFRNRRSEIWYVSRDAIRRGQIKGMTSEIAREMKQVTYKSEKTDKVRIMVEGKDETKKRLGFSPDLAEAFFIMIDVARQRLGFNLAIQGTETVNIADTSFDNFVKLCDNVYANADYSDRVY